MAEKPLTNLVLAVESALPAIVCSILYDVHGSPFVKIQPGKLSPYLVYTTAVEILGTLDENQEQIHLSLLSYKRELIEQQSLRLFDKDAQTGMSTYLLYIKKKLCDVNFAFCAGTTEEQIFSNFNSVKKTDLVLCLIEKSLDSPSKLVFRSRECKIVQPESELNPDTRQCKDCLDFFSNFFISKSDKEEAEAKEKLTCPYMYCGKTFSYESSYQRHLSSHSLSPNISILSSSDITCDLDDPDDDESNSVKFDPEDEDRLKSDDTVPSLPEEAKLDDSIKKDEVKDEPKQEDSSNLIKGVTRLRKRKRGRPKTKKDKKKELSVKAAGSFRCETCGKNFQYEKSFKKHMDTHSSSQDLNATETENIPTQVFNKPINKKAKSVKFANSETPVCEVCSISFEDRKTFITHMKKNHRLALSCEECGQRFTFKRSLEIHRRRIHTSRNCSLCNIKFSSRKEFLIHDHHVHKNVPEPCYVCGKHIKRASMSQHLKLVHHGEEHRKHLCNICGNAYKTRTDLTRHYTKHTGQKDFFCSTCGKGFRFWCGVNNCQRRHEQNFRHKCPKEGCDKAFNTTFRLKTHMRTHDGTRPFKCPSCNYDCARKDNLQTHIRRIHKMTLEQAELVGMKKIMIIT